MSDRETEKMRGLQYIFLVECAMREWSHEKIDDMIYKIESVRRDVIK